MRQIIMRKFCIVILPHYLCIVKRRFQDIKRINLILYILPKYNQYSCVFDNKNTPYEPLIINQKK